MITNTMAMVADESGSADGSRGTRNHVLSCSCLSSRRKKVGHWHQAFLNVIHKRRAKRASCRPRGKEKGSTSRVNLYKGCDITCSTLSAKPR